MLNLSQFRSSVSFMRLEDNGERTKTAQNKA
jgi:hypothetical protein